MSTAVGGAVQPHKVEIPVYLLQLLLRWVSPATPRLASPCRLTPPRLLSFRIGWFRDGWAALSLPLPDGLPVSTLDGAGGVGPAEDWSRLLGLVLQVLGAAMAFWGSVLFRLTLRALSLIMAPLHRQAPPPKSLPANYLSISLFIRHISAAVFSIHGFSCRPCLSRQCGVLHPWAQVLLILSLALLGQVTCGALSFSLAFLCYLYRVSI